jgi:dolichol-phosphate mannosyltransferase
MAKRIIVIPTYNEAENIEILLRRLFKFIPEIDILVVDDNSPDGTAQVVRELKRQFPTLYLLERGAKAGLGSAYRAGFSWALDRGYEEIIEMDADLSHRVRDLIQMIEIKQSNPEISLIIGSRWISGGETQNWSKARQLLSRSANLYARVMLGMGIKDATAGFRIYSSQILRSVNLEGIRSEGYSFQIEMSRAVSKLGGKIVEVPITFREREEGVSKMSKKIVLEAIFFVTAWGVKRFLRIK